MPSNAPELNEPVTPDGFVHRLQELAAPILASDGLGQYNDWLAKSICTWQNIELLDRPSPGDDALLEVASRYDLSEVRLSNFRFVCPPTEVNLMALYIVIRAATWEFFVDTKTHRLWYFYYKEAYPTETKITGAQLLTALSHYAEYLTKLTEAVFADPPVRRELGKRYQARIRAVADCEPATRLMS